MTMQGDVEEFHRAMGHTVGETPAVRDEKLRINLITEEYKELLKALAKDNLLETIDGVCDLVYVALGTLVAAGVPIDPFWREVHRSNMAKLPDCAHCDGDGDIITTGYDDQDAEIAIRADCDACGGTGKGPALKRELDGKIMRPPGWTEPDLQPILDECIRHAEQEAEHEDAGRISGLPQPEVGA